MLSEPETGIMRMNTTLERLQAVRRMLSEPANSGKSHHTLEELFVFLQPIEFALACLLFSIPFLQPIPLPGLSTPLGLLLALVGILQIQGRGYLYLPRNVRMRRIEVETIQKILLFSEKLLVPLSRLPKTRIPARLRYLNHPRVLGVHVVLMASLLALPLPIPFSNTVPAWGIVLCSLSMIERSLYFLVFAYLLLLMNLFFFGGIVYLILILFMSEGFSYLFSVEGLNQLTSLIRDFFNF